MKVFFKWMPNFKHHRVIVDGVYVGQITRRSIWYFTVLQREKELMNTDNWPEVSKLISAKVTALNVAARLKS